MGLLWWLVCPARALRATHGHTLVGHRSWRPTATDPHRLTPTGADLDDWDGPTLFGQPRDQVAAITARGLRTARADPQRVRLTRGQIAHITGRRP